MVEGSVNAGDGSYLAQWPGAVAFVRWTESDGTLIGTFNYVTADPARATGTDATEISFTGIRHDDNVSITLNRGLGSTTALTGTVSGSSLTLAFPQADGQLADGTFQFATVANYNAAIAALSAAGQDQARVSASAAAASQEAELEAQQQAAQQAQQQREQQAVVDGANALASADLSGHVEALQDQVALADDDLQDLREDAAEGPGDNCVNASSTVYNDAASTLYNDQESSLYNEIESLKSAASEIIADRRQLLDDVDVLRADGLPLPVDLSSIIRQADDEIANAVAQANKVIKSVHAKVAAGYEIANGLAVGECAGSGPGSPPKALPPLTYDPN